MICKSCGAQVDDDKKFCPTCGHGMTTSTSQTESSIPRWFKWLLGLVAILCTIGVLLSIGAEDLTDTVEKQLDDLRNNKITEAYYNFTSKEFQEATSLEQFKEFLKSFPALSENQSVRFTERKVDESVGTLEAVLTTKGGTEVKAQYRLVFDKGSSKWKIQSVQFEDLSATQAANQKTSPEDDASVKKVFAEQMEKVGKKNFSGAYNENTSADFKKSTSQKQFEAFVNTQPGFFNFKDIKWDDSVTNGQVVFLKGSMITSEDQTIPVVYQFVKEDGTWKVLHIEVGSKADPIKTGQADVSKKMEFSQFVLGTSVDEEGVVRENLDVFPVTTKEIYLNVYVANGVSDAKIEVELEHVESNSKIPAVKTQLKEDGHAILTIVFSPPAEGWPKGNYRINASSSTGAKKSYDFKVE
jgi:hypothetical protein